MCGIAGFVGKLSRGRDRGAVARAMTDAIRHRGPDDAGIWSDDEREVTLGHRRLSIIDLSELGHQPMSSDSGRYVIVYNGEIYNFQALSAELVALGHVFRGHSDTEVLLALVERQGLERALEKCVGMFALALWDRQTQSLHLARDRAGEKPLYYGHANGGHANGAVVFASELHAIRAFPDFQPRINRRALALFTRFNYVPAPHTIYEGISKVMPGEIVVLQKRGEEWASQSHRYWDAVRSQRAGEREPFTGSPEEATAHLDMLVRQSISGQMVADVPLGAFLSGGIDSSTVVGVMQSISKRPVRTFTIGFAEKAYDESQHASAVAAHLGTDHTELRVSPRTAMDVIPSLPKIYDEPFADASQVPTFLVSQLARSQVTVSLSGDGGDELFGGYNRYSWADAIWKRVGWMPGWGRRALAGAIEAVPPTGYDRAFALTFDTLKRRQPISLPGDKLHKIARVIRARNQEEIYGNLVTQWMPADDVVLQDARVEHTDGAPPLAEVRSFEDWMMLRDLLTYLRDDILVKVDRASMAVSLESRVPFLDHRVIEFAHRLPLDLKIRGGTGKWLLRQVAYKYVPAALLERPKTGFGIPIDSWLRGPLRDWAESLLDPRILREQGFFDAAAVNARWQEHLSGRRQWQYHLWTVLMFQAWLSHQQSTPVSHG